MNSPTSHILVPVDYSEKSAYGLQMAAKLLAKYGGRVTVLNVLKGVDPIFTDFFTEQERVQWLERLQKHLKAYASKYIDTTQYPCQVIIEKGKLCDTILRVADEQNVTLIAMGTSTADNIKKKIIGTNALRIVSESPVPVVTVKSAPLFTEVKSIVLPLDITKESREKTVKAVNLAKHFNASIHVVSAYTLNDDSIIKRLQLQMNQVVEYIAGYNIPVTSALLKVDNQVEGVLKFIDEKNADLVVITTHQQLEIVNSFIGSFAKSIIHAANIPVVSIVPKIEHYIEFALPGT